MSIETKNINKYYGKQHVLKDVSIKLKAGEIAGFLGPNGAGKSTLMKILTGYITPNSGSALVNNYNILTEPKKARQTIGYLPEHNPLYLELYVKEYLKFVAGIYKLNEPNKKIKEVIEATGLEKEKHKKIGALSKGYRQRVGIAQAIIHNPEVLILDEPTSGLDPNQIEEIRNLIKQISKDKTIIFSTHILQEVEAICDKIIIINLGKIVIDKTKAELKKINESKNIELHISFNKKIQIEEYQKIKGVVKVENIKDFSYKITITQEQVQNNVLEYALKEQYKIQKIEIKQQSLEGIFKNLTSS